MYFFDQSRLQALKILNSYDSEEEFLDYLQQAYQRLGIGQELDFADVRQACQQNTSLPLPWRLELFKHTPSQQDYNDFTFGKFIFFPNFTPHGFYESERITRLLSPFLTQEHRSDLLRISTMCVCRFENLHPSEDFEKAFQDTLGKSFLQWAHDLAFGNGELATLSEWLLQENQDPGLLAATLTSKPELLTQSFYNTFAAFRLLLLRISDALLQPEHLDAMLPDLLIQHVEAFFEQDDALWDVLWQNYFGTLLNRLVLSPSLSRLMDPAATRFHRNVCKLLFENFALWDYAAHNGIDYDEFLRRIPDELLSNLRLPTYVVTHNPDVALRFEQQVYQRCQEIRPRLHTAAALTWYESILTELNERKSFYFDFVFKELLSVATPERRLELFKHHLMANTSFKVDYAHIESFADPEQLLPLLGTKNERLGDWVVDKLCRLTDIVNVEDDGNTKHPKNWQILMQATTDEPSIFIKHYTVFNHEDPARLALLWQCAKDANSRQTIGSALFYYLKNENITTEQKMAYLDAFAPVFLASPKLLYPSIKDQFVDKRTLLKLLKNVDSPALCLVPYVVVCYVNQVKFDQLLEPFIRVLLNRALVAYPDILATLANKDTAKLFGLLDDTVIMRCLPLLSKVFEETTADLRLAAVRMLARCQLHVIEDSHLLAVPSAQSHLALIAIGSAANTGAVDASRLSFIQRQLAHKAHSPYSLGLSLDALERAGVDLDDNLYAFDDWRHLALDELQQRANLVTILPEIEQLWDATCETVFAPLGAPVGKLLLQQLQEGLLCLPRSCRQILALLSAEQQYEFAHWCLDTWLADKGTALDWLLLSISYIDDLACAKKLVSALAKLPSKKVPAALTALIRMPNNLGLALLNDVKRGLKRDAPLMLHIKQVFALEAQQRGITVDALISV
jgi:hypothetical protein